MAASLKNSLRIDLARENLIAAIALNPPAVRTVVYGAVLGCVNDGQFGARLFTRSPRRHAAKSTAVSQDRAPWRSCGSRPSRTWSGTAPGDRPASRRAECDRHKWRHDEASLPGRVRRKASRRLWHRRVPVDRRYVVSGRRQYDRRAMRVRECIRHDDKAASRLAPRAMMAVSMLLARRVDRRFPAPPWRGAGAHTACSFDCLGGHGSLPWP